MNEKRKPHSIFGTTEERVDKLEERLEHVKNILNSKVNEIEKKMVQMVNDLEERINSKITDLTNLTTVNQGHPSENPSENHESPNHIISNSNLYRIVEESKTIKGNSNEMSSASDYVGMTGNTISGRKNPENQPRKKGGSRKTRKKKNHKNRQ